jgi:hypothetical protein
MLGLHLEALEDKTPVQVLDTPGMVPGVLLEKSESGFVDRVMITHKEPTDVFGMRFSCQRPLIMV